MPQKQKASKQDRQRKSAQNLRYKAEHRRDKNKVLRLRKHLRRFPDDDVALQAAKLASAALGKTFVMERTRIAEAAE